MYERKTMQLLVNISDNKADFILELLNSFHYVKTKKISESKYKLLEDISAAVQEVKLSKKSNIKPKLLEDFLNEL